MEPSDSIARLGFARWYERRLIEAHAWFVSVFFCMVAIAACLEEISFRGSPLRALLYALIVTAAAAIGVYAMSRYHRILVEAEYVGEQATCAGCGAYARFKVQADLQVRCRKCGHEWRLVRPE
jgi:DNA-directed RNA polymerase subunit RPC12/RpoP